MNGLDYIFRGFIFLLTLPFGAAAALIPAYIGGEILSFTGIPLDWCRWAIGIISTLLFCMYIQAQLFPSNTEIDAIATNPQKLRQMEKLDEQPKQTRSSPVIPFLLGYWLGKNKH